VNRDVAVIVGVGGMGLAIARRVGPGRALVLADRDESALASRADALRGEGHDVVTRPVDVAEPESVASLAAAAAERGPVTQVVHTAGVSPARADPEVIFRVDVLGVALVLDAFAPVIARGGAGVVIASTAGHLVPQAPPDQRRALATTPAFDLLQLPFLAPGAVRDSAMAYGLAKQANILRVRAAAGLWGRRGARVNSISPGVVLTPMGHEELAGPWSRGMRALIEASAAGRAGTPEDVADVAAFLLGPAARFVTGTDLVVDGGQVAAFDEIHAPTG
jgi:NAD(P)-dependent dehydrogenase (short-subunit alcohol dehydrogenase family)